MTARATDWALAAVLACLTATGALTLLAGASGDAWVFAAHDALGVAIGLVLVVKVRRVWPRLAQADRRAAPAALALVLVTATLAFGFMWANGITPAPGGYSLLSWHDALGAALVIAVALHMALRAKRLRRRDIVQRRQFLAAAGLALASLAAWRLERPAQALFGLRASRRRFTGSYEAGSFSGNAFPATSWVADDPRPISIETYRLRIGGLVTNQLALPITALAARDELTATLDCTGGFFSTQRWRGVCLASVIAHAGPAPEARHLSVISKTGYRWSFALSDAGKLLLATHVGSEPLSHDHGAPVRLVVPWARGFQWVKWVERIELRDTPDYGAPASTLWSSFSPTGSGST